MKALIEFYNNFDVPIIIVVITILALPVLTTAADLDGIKWILVIAHALTLGVGVFIGIKAANDRA